MTPQCNAIGCDKKSVHIVDVEHPLMSQVKIRFHLCVEHFNNQGKATMNSTEFITTK